MTITSSPFQSPHSSIIFDKCPKIAANHNTKGRDAKWDPAPVEENPARQEGLNFIAIRDPIRLGLVDKEKAKQEERKEKGLSHKTITWHQTASYKVSQEEFDDIADPVKLCERYEDLIEHHVTLRTALVFQQFVVCANTPFVYRIAHTDKQFLTAKTLTVCTADGSRKTVSYQAAHPATIPGLDACLLSDYEKKNNPDWFSFLPESHLDEMNNSTNGLPTYVNQMDTLMDGQSRDATKVRGTTIALTNEVARGKIDAIAATRQFLVNFQTRLETGPNNSKSMTPAKRLVITKYLKKVGELIQLASTPLNAQGQHPFFDSLLDVNFRNEKQTDVPVIREIVYRRKFEIIREAEFTGSKVYRVIAKQFPDAKNADLQTIKLCLVHMTGNDRFLQKALEKLFCISDKVTSDDAALCNTLAQHTQQNRAKYQLLLRDIKAVIQQFNKMEQCFQAMLLQNFRTKLRRFTQKQLSTKMAALIGKKILAERAKANPDNLLIRDLRTIATSPANISRLENSRIHEIDKAFVTPEGQRRKQLTLLTAKIISEALNIQTGHFFCSFFASKN